MKKETVTLLTGFLIGVFVGIFVGFWIYSMYLTNHFNLK